MKKLMELFDRVNTACAYLAGALFVFMMVIITLDIILRFFFGFTLGWVVQLSGYIMLYMTFLGAAWLLKRDGHVAIDIVFNLLNARFQHLVSIITSLTGVILCFIIFWYGVATTWDSYQRGIYTVGGLHWPEWLIIGIIPYGSFMLTVQFMRIAYGRFKKRSIQDR